jgi:hypothetical protein
MNISATISNIFVKLFGKRQTKQQKATQYIQKYLAATESFRSKAVRVLTDTDFHAIRQEVQAASARISPSGSNGRMPEFVAALDDIFSKWKIESETYWCDVWLRNGKKPLGHYNMP